MGTLRFFEEVVSFKIRRTFGFADYTVGSRDGNTVPIFLRISIFCVRNSRCRFRESPENGVSFFGQMFTYIPEFRK